MKLSKSRISEIIQEELKKRDQSKRGSLFEAPVVKPGAKKAKKPEAPKFNWGPGYADLSEEDIGIAKRAWLFIATMGNEKGAIENMEVRPPTAHEIADARRLWDAKAEDGWDGQMKNVMMPGFFPKNGKVMVEGWDVYSALAFRTEGDGPLQSRIRFHQQGYNFTHGQLKVLEQMATDLLTTDEAEASIVLDPLEKCANTIDDDLTGFTSLDDMQNTWRILAGIVNGDKGPGLEQTALFLKIYAYRRMGLNIPTAVWAGMWMGIGGAAYYFGHWSPRSMMRAVAGIVPRSGRSRAVNKQLQKVGRELAEDSAEHQVKMGFKPENIAAGEAVVGAVGEIIHSATLGGDKWYKAFIKQAGLKAVGLLSKSGGAFSRGWDAFKSLVWDGGFVLVTSMVAASALETIAPTLVLYYKYQSVKDMKKLAKDIKNQSSMSLYGHDEEFAAYRDSAAMMVERVAAIYGDYGRKDGPALGSYSKAMALKDLGDLTDLKTGKSHSHLDNVDRWKEPPCFNLADDALIWLKKWWADNKDPEERTLRKDLSDAKGYEIYVGVESGKLYDGFGNRLTKDGDKIQGFEDKIQKARDKIEESVTDKELLRQVIREAVMLREDGLDDLVDDIVWRGGKLPPPREVVRDFPMDRLTAHKQGSTVPGALPAAAITVAEPLTVSGTGESETETAAEIRRQLAQMLANPDHPPLGPTLAAPAAAEAREGKVTAVKPKFDKDGNITNIDEILLGLKQGDQEPVVEELPEEKKAPISPDRSRRRRVRQIQAIIYPDDKSKHTGKWTGLDLDPAWWGFIDRNWDPQIHGDTPWTGSAKDIKWPEMVTMLESDGIEGFTVTPRGALRFIEHLRDKKPFPEGTRTKKVVRPPIESDRLGNQKVGKVTDPRTGLVVIVSDEGKIHHAKQSKGFNIRIPRPTGVNTPPSSPQYQPPLHGGIKSILLKSGVPRGVTPNNIGQFEIMVNPFLGGVFGGIGSESDEMWKQRIVANVRAWLQSKSQDELDRLFSVDVEQ